MSLAGAPPVVLASQSPRRKELLAVLGIPFSVMPAAIDETPKPGEAPEAFAIRIAREKAIEVSGKVSQSLVLAADTIVTIDGEILGKPSDPKHAAAMLQRLSGRKHSVYTAICMINQLRGETFEELDRTDVWFSSIDEAQIQDYIRREHVMDKAGAYAIQGFASVHIPKIEGSFSNVMGLPLHLVYDLLLRAGT